VTDYPPKGLIGSGPRGWGWEPRLGRADFVTGAKHVVVQILRALSRVVALVRMYIIKQAKARNSEAGEGRNSKSNGEIDVGVWMKSAAAAFLRRSQRYS
jgi:hypothetical protein